MRPMTECIVLVCITKLAARRFGIVNNGHTLAGISCTTLSACANKLHNNAVSRGLDDLTGSNVMEAVWASRHLHVPVHLSIDCNLQDQAESFTGTSCLLIPR